MDYAKIRPATEQLTTSANVELACKEDGEEQKHRRFSMLAYTGTPVERLYGKAVFSIGGIEHKVKVPILMNHDESAIVGYADKVEVTDEGMRLSGVISNATDAGKQIAQLADEGFPWEASIGIAVNEWSEVDAGESLSVNGLDVPGPASVGTKSRLLEVSFVTAGADKFTAADVLAAKQKEALVANQTDAREALASYRGAFPGREDWATEQFLAGKTVDEARLALSSTLSEELTATKGQLAEALKRVAELETDAATIQTLKAKARTPGVGFDGEARQNADGVGVKLTADQAWEKDANLRAEFFNRKEAFTAFVSRHGWE